MSGYRLQVAGYRLKLEVEMLNHSAASVLN